MSKKSYLQKYQIKETKEQAWIVKEALKLLFEDKEYQKVCWKCQKQAFRLLKTISTIVNHAKREEEN